VGFVSETTGFCSTAGFCSGVVFVAPAGVNGLNVISEPNFHLIGVVVAADAAAFVDVVGAAEGVVEAAVEVAEEGVNVVDGENVNDGENVDDGSFHSVILELLNEYYRSTGEKKRK